MGYNGVSTIFIHILLNPLKCRIVVRYVNDEINDVNLLTFYNILIIFSFEMKREREVHSKHNGSRNKYKPDRAL